MTNEQIADALERALTEQKTTKAWHDLQEMVGAAIPHLRNQAAKVNELTGALREIRQSLQFANDSPGGGINDTIWMMDRPATLFDFIDSFLEGDTSSISALRSTSPAPSGVSAPAGYVLVPLICPDDAAAEGRDVLVNSKDHAFGTAIEVYEAMVKVASAPAANAQPGELPPLPHATYNGYGDGSEPLYTADQMQAYARAAIAASAAKGEQQ